ncbi:hypothetical protein OG21DRAFT_1527707 [Imleria badia]|nr:hypothetical protein OG21DRAFT_1527707 [Imleria badia]
MDGNFKAEHMYEKRPGDQVWLMDGLGYMVACPEYKEYLKNTYHPPEPGKAESNQDRWNGTCSAWLLCPSFGGGLPERGKVNMDYSFTNAMKYNMGNITQVISFYDINCNYIKKLHARVGPSKYIEIPEDTMITPGIGIWHIHGHWAECFARHAPLFIPGAGWVDGEIIETLWSVLNIASWSARGMSSPHRQELLDFQMNDSNFMKMIQMTWSLIRKLQTAKRSALALAEAFKDLDTSVPGEHRTNWEFQECTAQMRCIVDPSAMDLFDVQLEKAPTAKAIKLELLTGNSTLDVSHGRATTWLARGLKIQESQILVSKDMRQIQLDRLGADISAFLSEASTYLGTEVLDDMVSDESEGDEDSIDEDVLEDVGCQRPDQAKILLPSVFGATKCHSLGLQRLCDMELRLRTSQANDDLHEIRIALANKVVLFRTGVWNASSHAKTTRAWTKDLRVSSAAAAPNARGHWNEGLAWFWTMDIPRDTKRNSWMSEFYRVHWLRAKALRDRWKEEEELLMTKFQWAIGYFGQRAEAWGHLAAQTLNKGFQGAASYAARQQAMYGWLREQCRVAWESFHLERPESVECSL